MLLSHKAAIVRELLKQGKVVELPHPPYSPDFASCDFSHFQKKHLFIKNIKRKKISSSAIFQCLNSKPRKDHDNFKKWIKTLKFYIPYKLVFSVGTLFLRLITTPQILKPQKTKPFPVLQYMYMSEYFNYRYCIITYCIITLPCSVIGFCRDKRYWIFMYVSVVNKGFKKLPCLIFLSE
jgi:hypothetical protein